MAGIVLEINVDDREGTVKIKQFSDEVKKAFDEMRKGPAQAKGPLDSLKESWVGLTAKVTAATAVVYGAIKAFSSFADAAVEAEQVENRLRFALETTGYTWNYAKQAVDEFARSIQASTRFSDDQARQALMDMMLYTNDFAKAQMGAKLAMDMSVRTGQDLHSTSRLIGMAMSGNVEMLGRYIPELRNLEARLGENATMAQKAEYAMKTLHEKFGGTAQADLDTYAGKVAQLKNAWSDFKKMIGKELLPPLKELLDTLKGIWEQLTREPPPYKEIPIAKFWGIEITRRVPLKGEELSEIELQRARIRAFQSRMLAAEIKKDIFPPEKEEKLIFDPRTIVDQVRAAINQVNREYEALGIAALEANQKMIEAWDIREPDVVDQTWAAINQVNREYEALGIAALEANQKMIDAWDIPSADEILAEIDRVIRKEEELGQAAINRMELQESTWRMQKDQISQWETFWKGAIDSIGQSFQAGFFDLFKGGIKDMSDWWKGFCNNLVQSFSRAIAQMVSNWIIFGNITGQSREKGGGWGGVLGWVSKIFSLFHGGGIVGEEGKKVYAPAWFFQNAPKLHSGLAPDEYPAILQKGEAVFTPGQMRALRDERGRVNANIFYIYANDPISFRDFVRRNPEAIIEVFNQDVRSAGSTRGIINSV